MPCDQGPYIWDKTQHFEGIGSEFNWHKPSFVAVHQLNGKWIGNLTHGHHKEEGDLSSYFGLNNSDCDEMSLQVYKDVHPDHFMYAPKEETNAFFISFVRNRITKNTVIVFEWESLD